jgi:hypothetical protein
LHVIYSPESCRIFYAARAGAVLALLSTFSGWSPRPEA